jgi:phosphonate transport system substrate-binding protein
MKTPLRLRRRSFLATAVLCSLYAAAGCGPRPGGRGGNDATPATLTLGFVPSLEADKIGESAQPIADFLGKELGVPVKTFTATSYVGLIEAMGSGKTDIGALNSFGYVLGHEQNGAKILVKTSRKGKLTYQGIFVARADSGIKSIEEAKNKRMAWVDPASTSGYLFPAAYLKSQGHDPNTFFSQTKFAGSHDNAVRAVYNGDVDVAAVYDDVRERIIDKLPDIKEKVAVIGKTEPIPNDTFSVRKDLDPALAEKIKAALLKYAASAEGKKTLLDTFDIDGLAEAQDSDYDVVRRTKEAMNITPESLDKK